ncbi:MAG: Fe-S cluster assembly protein SufD [Thermoflexales bacterium]|nr:Fe-S cluster assembly protein SufD [Thermoflexales bacterium]
MSLLSPMLKPAPVVKPGELNRERVEAYSAALGDPEWLAARRMDAFRVFRDTPAPNRHDELWRRVDLSLFNLERVIAAVDPSENVLALELVAPLSQTELRQHGVVFAPFERAARDHSDLLQRYFMTECVKVTDAFFAALHGVFVRGGAVLYVPAGVKIEAPFRTFTRMRPDQRTGFNHTLIVLEEGAQAVLIEDFATEGTASSDLPQAFYNGAVEIILKDGAQLDYVSVQDWGRNVYNFTTERARVGARATLHWVVGGVGSKFTKSLIEADLVAPHGTALLSGVYFADTRQQLHYDTQQNHYAEACKSDLLYKAALRDEARTVWRGNIRVFPGAQKTDAYQANRNLQLSTRSRADSIPGLEIEADDVRCTHGSTVGTIETEPMFYLQARGIPPVEARRLIVEGFFAPVIERIPLEETRERLLAEIAKKIG